MPSRSPPIPEEELHAYVDGELDKRRHESLTLQLQGLAEEAAKAALWRDQNQAVRAAFGLIGSEAIPAFFSLDPREGLRDREKPDFFRLPRRTDPVSRQGKSWRRFCQPGLVFIFGALTAFVAMQALRDLAPFQPGNLVSEAARSQDLGSRAAAALQDFNENTAGGVPRSSSPAQAGLLLPSLNEDGFVLAGLRIFSDTPQKTACIFYAGSEKVPVALCVAPAVSDDLTLRPQGVFPKAAVTWRQKHASYGLSGPLPEPDLRALARSVQVKLAGFETPPKP